MTFEYPSAKASVEITKEDLTRLFFHDIDFMSKINGLYHFRRKEIGRDYELFFYTEEDMVKFVMEYL